MAESEGVFVIARSASGEAISVFEQRWLRSARNDTPASLHAIALWG